MMNLTIGCLRIPFFVPRSPLTIRTSTERTLMYVNYCSWLHTEFHCSYYFLVDVAMGNASDWAVLCHVYHSVDSLWRHAAADQLD